MLRKEVSTMLYVELANGKHEWILPKYKDLYPVVAVLKDSRKLK